MTAPLHRHPPAAASADLLFTRTGPGDDRIVVPAGTRVAPAGGAVVFVTAWPAAIEPGQAAVTSRAYHGESVDGELLGVATGAPGQVFRVARAPIVSTDDADEILLGVAAADGKPGDGVPSHDFYGVAYELWRPVTTFAGAAGDDRVYLLDHASGTVTFAPVLDLRDTADAQPRVVAAVPPAGSQVRIWYRTGGGPEGNVAANTLTTMRDPIPGVKVTNPAPARGGRALEDNAGALARREYESSTQRRAITARDFEILAVTGSGGVARAGAFPGESVQVRLVPYVGPRSRPGWRLPAEVLAEHEDAGVLKATQRLLDNRKPLNTGVVTGWARYKPISVRGRVVIPANEDPAVVRAHLHERLYQLISPSPAAGRNDGRPFGEPLRAADVSAVVEQCLPAMSRVEDLRLVVRDAPDTRIRTVGAAPSRPGVWYAGCGEFLFRSTDAGSGWDPAGRFPGEEVTRSAPAGSGALAVVTRTGEDHSRVYLSADLGETWTRLAELPAPVTGMAWVDRDGTGTLLLTTGGGLHELPLLPGSVPAQVLVDQADTDRGFAAVTSFVSPTGVSGVALAAQARNGVYLSVAGGRHGTFTNIGVTDADVRMLAVQHDGTATFLWAGIAEADPNRPGKGCRRARLFGAQVHWEPLDAGWTGGSCWDVVFDGPVALAGTQSAGVSRLDTSASKPAWMISAVNNGLPLRDRTRFDPVEVLAAGADGRVLAGTRRGVFLRTATDQWTAVAGREKHESVSVPPMWLPCSAEHDVEVVTQ